MAAGPVVPRARGLNSRRAFSGPLEVEVEVEHAGPAQARLSGGVAVGFVQNSIAGRYFAVTPGAAGPILSWVNHEPEPFPLVMPEKTRIRLKASQGRYEVSWADDKFLRA